jgi:hypothetical protein
MESIVESRSQIVSVAGNLFTVFGVHRMVAEGTRSKQKLLALREKGVYSSYTSRRQWLFPCQESQPRARAFLKPLTD